MSTRTKRPPRGTDWLREFDLVPEEAYADMLGVTVKTLKNRPHSELPAFTKMGHRRLFRGESVRALIEKNTKTAA